MNDLFLDDDKRLQFDHLFLEQKMDFFKDNEWEKFLINPNIEGNYHVRLNGHNTSPKNFIKNGTLVLKLQRILNFNIDIRFRMKMVKSLEEDVQVIEKELNEALNVPVRILFQDILIPPNKK